MPQAELWLVKAAELGDVLAAANLERLRSNVAPSAAARAATA
eukprot:SAG31_NODE_14425_length_807_cov_1.220339_1_plen_41_part_10